MEIFSWVIIPSVNPSFIQFKNQAILSYSHVASSYSLKVKMVPSLVAYNWCSSYFKEKLANQSLLADFVKDSTEVATILMA